MAKLPWLNFYEAMEAVVQHTGEPPRSALATLAKAIDSNRVDLQPNAFCVHDGRPQYYVRCVASANTDSAIVVIRDPHPGPPRRRRVALELLQYNGVELAYWLNQYAPPVNAQKNKPQQKLKRGRSAAPREAAIQAINKAFPNGIHGIPRKEVIDVARSKLSVSESTVTRARLDILRGSK